MLLDMMKAGGYFYKHDFGRNKRSRKELKLSVMASSSRGGV